MHISKKNAFTGTKNLLLLQGNRPIPGNAFSRSRARRYCPDSQFGIRIPGLSGSFFWLLCLLLGFGPLISQAQETKRVMSYQEYAIAEKTINDSLQAAHQYLQNGQAERAERMATNLLKLYPLAPAYNSREYSTSIITINQLPHYPANVYALRARARETQRKYKAAETDITIALKGLPPLQRYFSDTKFQDQQNTWQYYEIRARLRLEHLKNKSGGCQDLKILYQLDSARLAGTGLAGYGCTVPKVRFATIPEDVTIATKVASDSLSIAEKALNQEEYAKALRILNNLIAGKVSRFERFMVIPERSWLKVKLPGQLWGMRAEAKEGLGDYKGAVADLDTAIIKLKQNCFNPGHGLWHYRRGLLRIDHLNDREGGCADLGRAYQCDTTITRPGHPKWRDCKLPAHKAAIGPQEYQEVKKLTTKTFGKIDSLLQYKHYGAALALSSDLVNNKAGRYNNVLEQKSDLHIHARSRRATALVGLGRYTEALAELDTAVKYNNSLQKSGWILCQRGTLKIDFLKDPNGCNDLRECYLKGYQPKDKNWRNCKFEERKASFRILDRYLDPVFGELDSWDLQLSVFNQGKTGASVGTFLSHGEWLANWGPSFGADIMTGYRSSLPVMAPKVGFEGSLLLLSSRLDLAYYGYKGIHDLRLTPQAGLSLLAIINVLYGYSIPLRSEEQPFLNRHRISLYINFVEASKIGG